MSIKNILNKAKNFILDWVWQLPQNALGALFKKVLIMNDAIWDSLNNENQHCIVYVTYVDGAVSLGKYIFVSAEYDNLYYIIAHEKGHSVQSKYLGPLYLIVIGLPSVIWKLIHKKLVPNKNYYWFYTEAWANKIAKI